VKETGRQRKQTYLPKRKHLLLPLLLPLSSINSLPLIPPPPNPMPLKIREKQTACFLSVFDEALVG
jgi:hypothetical protein